MYVLYYEELNAVGAMAWDIDSSKRMLDDYLLKIIIYHRFAVLEHLAIEGLTLSSLN